MTKIGLALELSMSEALVSISSTKEGMMSIDSRLATN